MRYLRGGGLSIDPALIEIHARGWAQARGLEPPVPDDGALRIEVGQPDQHRRYVFVDPPGTLAAHGSRIVSPYELLKAPMEPELVRDLLDARWQVERSGTIMAVDRLPDAGQVPDGYRLDLVEEGEVIRAIVFAGDIVAARGRMTAIDGHAIHDQIVTEPEHGRRGLGRAVMTALGAAGRDRGATTGLLAATIAGRSLYEKLGWRALAPWTTAQIIA